MRRAEHAGFDLFKVIEVTGLELELVVEVTGFKFELIVEFTGFKVKLIVEFTGIEFELSDITSVNIGDLIGTGEGHGNDIGGLEGKDSSQNEGRGELHIDKCKSG
jgi:hypothetical protein